VFEASLSQGLCDTRRYLGRFARTHRHLEIERGQMGTREVVRKVRRRKREGERRHPGGARMTVPSGARGEKAHQATTPGTDVFVATSVNV
jgi:hypothetical protein